MKTAPRFYKQVSSRTTGKWSNTRFHAATNWGFEIILPLHCCHKVSHANLQDAAVAFYCLIAVISKQHNLATRCGQLHIEPVKRSGACINMRLAKHVGNCTAARFLTPPG